MSSRCATCHVGLSFIRIHLRVAGSLGIASIVTAVNRLAWREPRMMMAFTRRGRRSECVRGRLPLPEALRDELGPLLLAPAVQHLEVRGVGSEVDAGGSGIQPDVAI